MSSTHPFRD
jgi:hypothetical protein